MESNLFDTDEFADKYVKGDFLDCDGSQKARALQTLLSNVANPSTLLDVGCATGNLVQNLGVWKMDFQYTGTDFSARMLHRARSRFPDTPFFQSKLPELPLKDNSFGTVICMNTLYAIRDFYPCILELFRVAETNIFFDLFYTDVENDLCTHYYPYAGDPVEVYVPCYRSLFLFLAETVEQYNLNREITTLSCPSNPFPSGYRDLHKDYSGNFFQLFLGFTKNT